MLNFLTQKVFEYPLIVSVASFAVQSTLIVVLILLLFALVILHEPISHLFFKYDKTEYQRFERRYFWQTMALIPIFSVPFIWVMYRYGIFQIYPSAENIGLMIIQLVAMIVLHDAYFYWCHRLMHSKALWNIHGIHHRATDPTVTTSHIFHYVETFINYTFIVWFTFLAGLTVGGVFFIPAIIFVLFTTIWNIYGHGKKNLFSENVTNSLMGRLIVWPSYHLEHHRQGSGNFEFFFTWWDKICGTEIRK